MKKSEVFSLVSIFFWIGVTLFLPLLISLGVVATSYASNHSFNWKIAAAFLILLNGWYYYFLYRATVRKLAQREANTKNGLTRNSVTSTGSDAKTGFS